MKNAVITAVLLAALIPLHGAKIAGDDFSYSTGGLDSLDGGFGWQGAWTATGGTPTRSLVAPGTAFSYVSGEIQIPVSQVNGSAQFESNANNTTLTTLATRSLSATATAATNQSDVYVSFLLRFTAGTLDDGEAFYLWFGAAGTPSQRYDIGILGNAGGDFQVRTDDDATANSYGTATLASNATTTYFIVGRLNKNASSNFNEFSVWLNPTTVVPGAPNTTSAAAGGQISTLSTLGFGFTTMDNGNDFQIDNLQIGDTWQDVITPVPFGVDSTLGLALLGGAAALRLRRRKAGKTA